MRRPLTLLLVAAALVGCGAPEAEDAPGTPSPAPAAVSESRLETSPRHHEWVDVTHGDRTVRAFVAFPERAEPGPAVLLIHENRGLTDWVRETADVLAENGYLTIAPDLLSGTAPDGGGTGAFADSDAARTGIYALPAEQVTADLSAVLAHVRTIPACDGTVAVAGFCWGGSQTFRFATSGADVAAACVFYGSAPDDGDVFAAIRCPVYGFYGGNDARINATLEATVTNMQSAGKTFEPMTYEGAGHAFLRRGGEPGAGEADAAAHAAAWERLLSILGSL